MMLFVKSLVFVIFAIIAGAYMVELALWVAKPVPEEVSVKEPTEKQDQAENKQQEPLKPKPCLTDYYAVVAHGGNPLCLRNPTKQIARYGPPGASWFGSDGEFRLKQDDIEPTDVCQCLIQQPAYSPSTSNPLSSIPVEYVIDGDNKLSILKWVCGMDCTGGFD